MGSRGTRCSIASTPRCRGWVRCDSCASSSSRYGASRPDPDRDFFDGPGAGTGVFLGGLGLMCKNFHCPRIPPHPVRSPTRAVHRSCTGAAAALLVVIALGVWAPRAHAVSPGHDPAWTTIPGTPPQFTGDAGRRMLYVGVWDTQRNRAVMFGGHPQFLNDTWTLDANATSWQQLTTSGTPPTARYGSYGVYDAA